MTAFLVAALALVVGHRLGVRREYRRMFAQVCRAERRADNAQARLGRATAHGPARVDGITADQYARLREGQHANFQAGIRQIIRRIDEALDRAHEWAVIDRMEADWRAGL